MLLGRVPRTLSDRRNNDDFREPMEAEVVDTDRVDCDFFNGKKEEEDEEEEEFEEEEEEEFDDDDDDDDECRGKARIWTTAGVYRSSWLPKPSRPCAPLPHVYNTPSTEIHSECALPHATCQIC